MTEPTILVASWTDGLVAVRGSRRVQEIAEGEVRGLAPDGHGGALALAGHHSLCRRSPDGKWTTVATSDLELSCCMAAAEAVYIGTDDARMLRFDPEKGALLPLEGFDHVPGRETWFAGSAIVNGQRLGPPLGVRSVAANATGEILFANVHVGGIPRSVDGGRTWQPTIDISRDVHEVRAHPEDPDLLAAASAVGLCLSRDGGVTWTVEDEGMHAAHCSAVAFAGEDILVSASTDPFAARGRVYRRPVRREGKIVALEDGFPEWTEGKVDTGCIASRGGIVATVDSGGNLYVSAGSGRGWLRWGGGFPATSSVLIR